MVLVLVLLQFFCASAGQLSGSRVNDGSPGSGIGATSHAGTRESTGSGASGSSSSSAFLFGANKPSAAAIEDSLQTIHDIATENLGTLCLTKLFRPLQITLNPERYTGARQKADLAAVVLQDVGVARHNEQPF